jgi:hypothetical protein
MMNRITQGVTAMHQPYTGEPTPAQHAAELKAALMKGGIYDDDDPSTSLSDLLADLMHLVDTDPAQIDDFYVLVERATGHYEAERNGHD